jgi:hypothetical protein
VQNLNALFGVAYRGIQRFSVLQLGYLGYLESPAPLRQRRKIWPVDSGGPQRESEKRDENSPEMEYQMSLPRRNPSEPSVTPNRSLKFELIWNLPPARATPGRYES